MKYYDVSYNEYKEFINFANEKISSYEYLGKKIQIVSIYRGSLNMGVNLSNILDLPLNILKFQSYDGKDDIVKEIYSEIEDGDILVLLDDIYDTGKTIEKCSEYLRKKYPESEIIVITMFGKKSPFFHFKETDEKTWIRFPWEV